MPTLAPVRRQLVDPVSPMTTRPSLCAMKPAMMRSSVVLPQPEGPSSATSSPALMSSVTLSTARNEP